MEINKIFVYDKIRDGQKLALNKIFNSDKNKFIIQAPTGSGKSGINMTLVNFLNKKRLKYLKIDKDFLLKIFEELGTEIDLFQTIKVKDELLLKKLKLIERINKRPYCKLDLELLEGKLKLSTRQLFGFDYKTLNNFIEENSDEDLYTLENKFKYIFVIEESFNIKKRNLHMHLLTKFANTLDVSNIEKGTEEFYLLQYFDVNFFVNSFLKENSLPFLSFDKSNNFLSKLTTKDVFEKSKYMGLAYVITPIKVLQKQYSNEFVLNGGFEIFSTIDLYGKNNYVSVQDFYDKKDLLNELDGIDKKLLKETELLFYQYVRQVDLVFGEKFNDFFGTNIDGLISFEGKEKDISLLINLADKLNKKFLELNSLIDKEEFKISDEDNSVCNVNKKKEYCKYSIYKVLFNIAKNFNVILNFSNFFIETDFVKNRLFKREYLIIDEGHNTEDKLIDYGKIREYLDDGILELIDINAKDEKEFNLANEDKKGELLNYLNDKYNKEISKLEDEIASIDYVEGVNFENLVLKKKHLFSELSLLNKERCKISNLLKLKKKQRDIFDNLILSLSLNNIKEFNSLLYQNLGISERIKSMLLKKGKFDTIEENAFENLGLLKQYIIAGYKENSDEVVLNTGIEIRNGTILNNGLIKLIELFGEIKLVGATFITDKVSNKKMNKKITKEIIETKTNFFEFFGIEVEGNLLKIDGKQIGTLESLAFNIKIKLKNNIFKLYELNNKDINKILLYIEKTNNRLDVIDVDKFKDYGKINLFRLLNEIANLKNVNYKRLLLSCIDLQFEHISAQYISEELLFGVSDELFILSGTISKNFPMFIGIDDYEYIEVLSEFPKEKRPVHFSKSNSVKMSGNKQMSEVDREKLFSILNRIFNKHKEDNGIIHTVSYRNAMLIKEMFKGTEHEDRLIIDEYFNQSKKEQIIKEMDKRKGLIFVSPSIEEGIDLKDDMSRFQIILKLPFPILDYENQKKKDKFDKYNRYESKTVERILQMIGRSVRNKDDYAETYILDNNFGWFFHYNKELFGSDFLSILKIYK